MVMKGDENTSCRSGWRVIRRDQCITGSAVVGVRSMPLACAAVLDAMETLLGHGARPGMTEVLMMGGYLRRQLDVRLQARFLRQLSCVGITGSQMRWAPRVVWISPEVPTASQRSSLTSLAESPPPNPCYEGCGPPFPHSRAFSRALGCQPDPSILDILASENERRKRESRAPYSMALPCHKTPSSASPRPTHNFGSRSINSTTL